MYLQSNAYLLICKSATESHKQISDRNALFNMTLSMISFDAPQLQQEADHTEFDNKNVNFSLNRGS